MPTTSAEPKCYVVLFNLQKKHNIGQLLRSACAFGVHEVCLVGSRQFNTFGAQGTDVYLTYRHFPTLEECCEYLHGQGCKIIGVEITDDAMPVQSHPFTGSTAFMLGNEGTGLSSRQLRLCDSFLYIPQHGTGTASLNVTIAASIVLHHFATWAGYAERSRTGQKYDVADRPRKTAPRGVVPLTDAERASEQQQRQDNGHDEPLGPDYSSVQRNLALELVRVTEAAALAAGRWFGKGDKHAADQAAVDMMRRVLNTISMDGVIVIGEGEKDEAPMLVDPLDGTTLISQGRNGAVTVIAVSERGTMFDPGACMYMEKLAVPPEVRAWGSMSSCIEGLAVSSYVWRNQFLPPEVDPSLVSLDYPIEHNLKVVAKALRKDVSDVTVCLLDRPRHAAHIEECRQAGARIRLISDGDVAGAIDTAKAGSPVDVMYGIGGTPEGVIAAAALKCMGGSIQGRLWPRNDEEREKTLAKGYNLQAILTTNDLCGGDQVFFAATGVSDGDLLKGVRYYSGGASTNSMVMRSQSGTVRLIETFHRWERPGVTNIHDRDALLSVMGLSGDASDDTHGQNGHGNGAAPRIRIGST